MFIIPEKNHICCMKKRRLYLKIFRNLTPKTQIQYLTIIKLKIHIIQFLQDTTDVSSTLNKKNSAKAFDTDA